MTTSSVERKSERAGKRERFWIGLARAFGGAIFFSLPLLMTMEMWWLGFYMDRFRLALFVLLVIPLLVGLSHHSGFKKTETWVDDIADAGVAFAVAYVASAVVLGLFNVIHAELPAREIVGKLTLQAVPASIGAMLANSQLGGEQEGPRRQKRSTGYVGELFFMLVGAVFLAFNVAPTEEMILIAFRMTYWHALATMVVSLVLMHAFVYAVNFHGSHPTTEGPSRWGLFLRYTVVGYAIALLVSAYVLWTFGRMEDGVLAIYLMETVVLGFPASIGAAAARLIL